MSGFDRSNPEHSCDLSRGSTARHAAPAGTSFPYPTAKRCGQAHEVGAAQSARRSAGEGMRGSTGLMMFSLCVSRKCFSTASMFSRRSGSGIFRQTYSVFQAQVVHPFLDNLLVSHNAHAQGLYSSKGIRENRSVCSLCNCVLVVVMDFSGPRVRRAGHRMVAPAIRAVRAAGSKGTRALRPPARLPQGGEHHAHGCAASFFQSAVDHVSGWLAESGGGSGIRGLHWGSWCPP